MKIPFNSIIKSKKKDEQEILFIDKHWIEISRREGVASYDGIANRRTVLHIGITILNSIIINSDVIEFTRNNKKEIIKITDICNYGGSTIYFAGCQFNGITKITGELKYNYIFNHCNFDEISFKDVIASNEITQNKYDIKFIGGTFRNKFNINKCEFTGKFYINEQKSNKSKVKINYLEIQENTFNENFKLHNTDINLFKLSDVDFNKNADFYKSKVNQGDKKDIIIEGTNFKKITIFEECEFLNKLTFQYITFEDLVQFRGATFHNGLDLDRTNTEKAMNFYNIKELESEQSKILTSQETYRIIKYNLEKIGNIIDANKYHALELEKQKDNLKFMEKPLETIVFNINWMTSKFATNWLYPIIWIIIIGNITSTIVNYNCLKTPLELLYDGFKYMSILKFNHFENHPIIFLFNKVSLGYLYYQFITAVRKDTRK
ncbi:MAG: hypothetical protein GQ570_12370 [Helicobacteraceae bacterium]|nr:hypothetical protein [Helicobacteraceae bacterium]